MDCREFWMRSRRRKMCGKLKNRGKQCREKGKIEEEKRRSEERRGVKMRVV
jgi:hypothetical protein